MLGVEMQTTIKTLFNKGHNKSQISKLLGIDRKTVREILKQIELKGCVERNKKPSVIDEYKEYIEAKASKGLSATRIHQDMVKEFNFQSGYDVIRKYVSKLKKSSKAYMVLHSLPGEEAQVDFGYIGTLNFQGKRRKAWIFVMTLSYSRLMYVDVVFDQTVKTFINCHKKSFRYFGGVPETVKIDNLKAAILEADFYEPVVQKHYAAFSNHYGFMAEPCRVYTPTDKGKVESSVNYVKNNCFKGRDFKDYEEAKEFLKDWLEKIANRRIHGTTKKIPYEVFDSIEKEKLIPLPTEDYVFSSSEKVSVNTNCHISYKGNYYSVPHTYIGQNVEILEVNNVLKIFFEEKEIALHALNKDVKGQHITNKNHYPKAKNITRDEILSRQRLEMQEIGEYAVMFFENFIKSIPYRKYDYRSISGVLSLRKQYNKDVIDAACRRACEYGAYSYKVVKKICEKDISALPIKYSESYVNFERTPLSRSLSEYDELAERGVIN